MADQRFRLGKGIWDFLVANNIEYSTNGDAYLDVSDFTNLPLLTRSAIIGICAGYGFDPE